MGHEVIDRALEVTACAIVRQPLHQLARHLHVVGYLAAIEVRCQADVALGGEAFGVALDPIGQAPPFVDDDDGRERSLAIGHSQEAFYFVLTGLEGDVLGYDFGVLSRAGGCGESDEERQGGNKAAHDANLSARGDDSLQPTRSHRDRPAHENTRRRPG